MVKRITLILLVSLLMTKPEIQSSSAQGNNPEAPCAALAAEATANPYNSLVSTAQGGGAAGLDTDFAAEISQQMKVYQSDLTDPVVDLEHVGLIGKLYGVGEGCLVMHVYEPVTASPELLVTSTETLTGAGITGRMVTVLVPPQTYIVSPDSPLADLPRGTPLLVGGSLSANTLTARLVADYRGFKPVSPPPEEDHPAIEPGMWTILQEAAPATQSVQADVTQVDAATKNLVFQGQLSGLAFSGTVPVNQVVLDWKEAGLKISVRSITFLITHGYQYRFPFSLKAEPGTDLVEGRETPVSLLIQPQRPPEGEFSFFGGDGGSIVFNLYIESPSGNFDYSPAVGVGMQSRTSAAPPMPGEKVRTEEAVCNFLTVLYDGFILDLCETWELDGSQFSASLDVTQGALREPVDRLDFDGKNPQIVTVIPQADPLRLSLKDFNYTPHLHKGFFFKLKYYVIPLLPSDPIWIGDCWLPAVEGTRDATENPCGWVWYGEQSDEASIRLSVKRDETPPVIEFALPEEGQWNAIAEVQDALSGMAEVSVNCKIGSFKAKGKWPNWPELEISVPAYAPGANHKVPIRALSRNIKRAEMECLVWAVDLAGNHTWKSWIKPSKKDFSQLSLSNQEYLYLPMALLSTSPETGVQVVNTPGDTTGPQIEFSEPVDGYWKVVATVQDQGSGMKDVSANCKIGSLKADGKWPDWAVLEINVPAYVPGTTEPMNIRGFYDHIRKAEMTCGLWAQDMAGNASWKLYK